MGALPTLYAACALEAEAGKYYGPGGWKELKGWPVEVASRKLAVSSEERERLWDLSEELCGIEFAIA